MCVCVCVCVCNQPPVCEMCPNYEVVVLKPWTVTPTHLCYVAYHYTFKLAIPPQLFLLPLSGLFISTSFLLPPHPHPLIAEDL